MKINRNILVNIVALTGLFVSLAAPSVASATDTMAAPAAQPDTSCTSGLGLEMTEHGTLAEPWLGTSKFTDNAGSSCSVVKVRYFLYHVSGSPVENIHPAPTHANCGVSLFTSSGAFIRNTANVNVKFNDSSTYVTLLTGVVGSQHMQLFCWASDVQPYTVGGPDGGEYITFQYSN